MKQENSFIQYFVYHPTAANLLMVIFFFIGILTVGDLRRETMPDFTSTEIEIVVPYPGATAEEVENAICQRIEDALDSVTDVYEIRSEAREGSARVVVEMVEEGNMQVFLDDVKTEVEAIDDFPDEIEKPIIKQLGRTDMVLSVAVTGPMSVPHLKIFCEQVKDRMLATGKINQVDILGFSEHQIRVEIPAVNLMQFGLSVFDIAEKIERQSVDLPSGMIESRERDILIRFTDERRSVREIEDLIVMSGKTGAELRLKDIAVITDRFELDEEKIIFNGKRAGLLQINKTKSQDALVIREAVKEFLDRERRLSPPDVEFTITRDVSKIVKDRLKLLVDNGIAGLILVVLTMWLFFSFRYSFWVAMGLPVSFLGTFFFMNYIDFSINMLTMVGLLLALGLLMDDAIVIAENIASQLKKGESPTQAAVKGIQQVGMGVFSSYLTTVFVFGSISLFIKGDIGKVLWVMPVVVILTLTVSLIEAFLILPNHLAHSLKSVDMNSRFRQRFELFFDKIRDNVVGKIVDWAVSWRYFFIGLVGAAFFVSLAMVASGVLKTRAFPELDGDVLEARILLPQGTPLWRTEQVVSHINAALEKVNQKFMPLQPDNQSLIQNVNIRFSQNNDSFESGPHLATVTADLLSAETRNAAIDDIANLWRQETGTITDVITITYKEPVIGPGGLAIDIRLQGSDLNRLKQASLDLMNWLDSYKGVLDLHDDLRPGKPEIHARLRDGAMTLGVDAALIASQLRAAFYGRTAQEVQAGAESYEIDVRLSPSDKDNLADLEYFYITTQSGKLIPLGAVAELEQSRGFARIYRINSVRTVTIQGDVDSRIANANQIIADTKARFLPEFKKRYPDIDISLEGQAKEGKKSGQSMLKALMVGIFGVFVLLSIQFKSYYEPLIVIAAIPLAFIGVIWGHIVMGLELSMPSFMGFVSLAGVVVNDSILLVTFIKLRHDQYQDIVKAAKTASRDRFRAVFLTSLTTIMGVLPLLTEKSLQAQILIPLVTSLVFGIIASTFLVLFVIPSLYAVLGDMGLIAEGK
jgi:HAE1 family hydrophobic/amphiphilic exporter-1